MDIQIRFLTTSDFTDESLLRFIHTKDDLRIEEYIQYLKDAIISNPLAAEVIRFIVSYDDNFLRPDKCDAYEPVKERFDISNISQPVKWLSQPGGALFLLKRNSYQAVLENMRFAPIWEDSKQMKPSVKEPEFRGEVIFYLKPSFFKRKDIRYWGEFLKSLSLLLSASYAYISIPNENAENEFSLTNVKDVFKIPIDYFEISYYSKDLASLLDDLLKGREANVKVLKKDNYCLVLPVKLSNVFD